MFTPGKKRRQSLMGQREDAMQLLKNLGRALAPTSQPISSSSSSGSSASSPATRRPSIRSRMSATIDYDDEFDDDAPLPRPRLSLPIDNDDDDEDLQRPELSQLDPDQTVELPRRFLPPQRDSEMPRMSLGSLHGGDFPNHDPTGEVDMPSEFSEGAPDRDRTNLSFDRGTVEGDLTRRSSFDLQMPDFPDFPDEAEDDAPALQFDSPERSPSQARSLLEVATGDVMDSGVEPEVAPAFDDFGSDRGEIEDFSSSDEGVPGADDGIDDRGAAFDDIDHTVGDIADITAISAVAADSERTERTKQPLKKRKRISRHGIEYPSLPSTFVKRVAQNALQNSGLSNTRISADTLAALEQASDWFFEQLGDDLEAYASHAKRKTIEESDVVTLMRRQRQVGSNSTVFSLAQKHLPRELLQELRMPPPQPVKRRQSKRARDEDDNGEEAA
uniref:CENP-T/Histone H4 histone fold domain-containing protein n=1 Tax=Bionectria ochroleuca TaxID=29856 RepID=A0A0B7K2R4_BIOOC